MLETEQAAPLTAHFQVDINSASQAELEQLPGIGPALGQRIIESRETKGPFKNVDDLRRVKGIGPKKAEQMRPYLRAASSPSTRAEP